MKNYKINIESRLYWWLRNKSEIPNHYIYVIDQTPLKTTVSELTKTKNFYIMIDDKVFKSKLFRSMFSL